jgi:hypothetical protein
VTEQKRDISDTSADVPYIHHTICLILQTNKMLKMAMTDKAMTALALEKLSAR